MAEPLTVKRFFETPLIRDRIEGLDAASAEAAVRERTLALAGRFTGDAEQPARAPRWRVDVEAGVEGGDFAPGAFWCAWWCVAGEAVLTVEDPRLPMTRMHAPALGFRAPDGVAAEPDRPSYTLRAGEGAMLPGWLRHRLEPRADAVLFRVTLFGLPPA